MAVVPITQGPRIAEQPLPSNGFRAADFGSGGEQVGRAVSNFGNAVGDYAQMRDQVQGVEDQAVVKEADNAISSHYAEIGYTGADPYFTKQGKDALLARPVVEKSLSDYIAKAREGLQNERQRHLFDQSVHPRQNEWLTQIAAHSLKETATYEDAQSKARLHQQGELARLTYLDDPKQGEEQIQTVLHEVEAQGRKHGDPDEVIADTKLATGSAIYKDIGNRIALTGPNGPDVAEAFVEAHKGSMLSDDRDAVLSRVTVQRNQQEAEQRRIEAEQRRQASEARHDAHDRVESALGRMDSGLPLSTDEYASALADAKATEDPNLLKRVQESQFKNNLSIQHRDDTPTELQNRINALSAVITKAGAKADPQQIIERDHLQKLFTQSTSQLNNDPLGWLAAHKGAPIAPLNLDDPTSIKNRVQMAQAASNATGHAPAVFTPTEVIPLAQQWHTGTDVQKVNLVTRLARFGPMASMAAQQVAPNDSGLTQLVALASHSNKGVGLSRVTQAMAGYEAMKTQGEIVGKVAKLPDFNTYVGSALQFMPGARDGVFTVAKALLAEDASQRGWKDENDADPKAWYRAVNSALGAYTRGGVQLGGLADFNGAPTVLPENMSSDEFESRVSRATDAQFKSAGNGVPSLGNGAPLSAGDLKRMHFVPVDEGVYRLESGGSFVHTKDGRVFEMDVRKLNGATNSSLSAANLSRYGYARF